MIQTLKHKPHRISTILPSMTDDEKRDLAADIKANGLVEPIVLLDDDVLDGVHRQEACVKAGVTPRYIEFRKLPTEQREHGPLAYVLSKNLKRRHLTPSQRATVAADMVPQIEAELKLKEGSGVDGEEKPKRGRPKGSGKATEIAAEALNVSKSSVREAQKLSAKEKAEVKAGKKSLRTVSGRTEKEQTLKDKLETAHARIEKVCGKPLADAVRAKRRLKNHKEVVEFASMADADMKRIGGLIGLGWKLKKAKLFRAKSLSRKHLIGDLINMAASQGGALTVDIDQWRIKAELVKHAIV